MNKQLFFVLIFFILNCNKILKSSEIIIHAAVASNFLITFKDIAKNFEKKYNCKIIISSDSTVNLFTKIKYGAPFDIFIAADKDHPILLENKIDNIKSYIYAYGKITLLTNSKIIKKNFLIHISVNENIIIANSKLSPYGYASQNVYGNIKIKNLKIIPTMNINQAFIFVSLNSSNIGIVAKSQIMHNKIKNKYTWHVPKYLYKKIEQRLIVLKNRKKNHFIYNFFEYIKTEEVKFLIKKFGYTVNDK